MTLQVSTQEALVCPDCHGALARNRAGLACVACNLGFPVEDGIADFTQGRTYDEFPGPQVLSPPQREALELEMSGTTSRIEDFYLPLIALPAGAGPTLGSSPIRVLDSGCGNGISIDLLDEAGIEAWGNDLSALRRWQWHDRRNRERLVAADTRKLPFASGYFDVVLSSGVLEHIGVSEVGGSEYAVKPLPHRDEARIEFLGELLRVVTHHGKLYLDFPNGSFPVDFWHGTAAGAARFHCLSEGFLPRLKEVRRYLDQIGDYSLRALSPHRRLRMRQVARHWYGRALRWPMAGLLRSMELRPLRFLAATCLNPYLVLEVVRR